MPKAFAQDGAPAPHPSAGRGGRTRVRLLEGTVRVGARAGWGAITTRAVAEEAGLNPGLVHYHFGTLDELRRAAVAQVTAHLVAVPAGTPEGTGDPAAAIAAMVEAVATTGADADTTAFLYEAFLAARRDEPLRLTLAAVLRKARAELTGWVDALTASDAGRADPAAVAALVTAALDGIYVHRLLDPEFDPAVIAGPLHALLRQQKG
jgi:AcrR family transcriptional regulator